MSKHDFLDIRGLLDDVFGVAEDFRDAVSHEFTDFGQQDCCRANDRDFYPAYSYPPVNVYMTEDHAMVLQFALAGFSEQDINLEFKGDYLVFSATAPSDFSPQKGVRYFKRRLKLKSVKDQRYFVPADKYHQGNVNASLHNAILTVTIPPREQVQSDEGVKVDIKSTGKKAAGQAKNKDVKESKESKE